MVRFISNADNDVPVTGAGMFADPRTADLLVSLLILWFYQKNQSPVGPTAAAAAVSESKSKFKI